jgi:hypothetical protein
MLRRFHVVTAGGRLAYVVACALAATSMVACQPLYGGKPEKLATPQRRPKPAGADEPVVYKEECPSDFRGDPKSVVQQIARSQQLAAEGERAMASAEKMKDSAAQVSLIKEGIDKFRNALLKDPYSIDATLKLALAYDRVLYKGCALTMLKRLFALSNNPKWQNEANRTIGSIVDNTSWFKGYRKDATAAVGQ